MVSAKEAVTIAKQHAIEMLGETPYALEEIERDTYRERDVWNITLSIPRPAVNPGLGSFLPKLDYKRFLVDTESGEVLAMRIRELAA